MKYIAQVFVKGLLVLIPLVITFSILFWFLRAFENLFKEMIIFFYPDMYFSGMGVIVGLIFVFLIGFLMQVWGISALYHYGEKWVEKFPVIGDIYSTLKSILQYATTIKSDHDIKEQVVFINYPGYKVMGIVTCEHSELFDQGTIAVFVPMSYQVGGITLYVNKKDVTFINMSKKEALQWILTGGIIQKKTS